MSAYRARVERDETGADVIRLYRGGERLGTLTSGEATGLGRELEDCARHLLAASTADLLEALRRGGGAS